MRTGGITLACALSDFMNDLEEKINYCFNDKQLLEIALTHCSYAAEHGVKNNQRLEFLGDAVLEHVISKYIFDRFSEYDEGKMTRLRASIVSEEPLALAAEQIGLKDFVRLGTGERMSGGAEKPSVLSDTLESLFAAVYLDGGFESAQKVILSVLAEVISEPRERPSDYKTALQEVLFANGKVDMQYRIVSRQGPPHDSTFTAEVLCNGRVLGRGTGKSKKRAEQEAAKYALEKAEKHI